MRRSAVRTFERAGVPRSVAMSLVGHKTKSISRRYAIVDEAMQREAAARLDAWDGCPSASIIDGMRHCYPSEVVDSEASRGGPARLLNERLTARSVVVKQVCCNPTDFAADWHRSSGFHDHL